MLIKIIVVCLASINTIIAVVYILHTKKNSTAIFDIQKEQKSFFEGEYFYIDKGIFGTWVQKILFSSSDIVDELNGFIKFKVGEVVGIVKYEWVNKKNIVYYDSIYDKKRTEIKKRLLRGVKDEQKKQKKRSKKKNK